MRITRMISPALARASVALMLSASPLLAQEGKAEAPPGLLTLDAGLMFWSLIVFVALLFVLWKFAFPAILGAVEAREAALEKAITEAKADRDAAAKLLADQKAQIDAARAEAQKVIVDGRGAAEQLKTHMLEETRKQQQELLERARRDIETQKTDAIAELRREAVGLAIAAAGKVIEKNLDDAQNRKLVDSYLAGLQ